MMWQRLWSYLKSLLPGSGKNLDNLYTPERLLAQAHKETRKQQTRNRERAVKSVTERNNLQKQCAHMRSRIELLWARADAAEQRGDREAAEKFRSERAAYEKCLNDMETQLEMAVELSEQAKRDIEREQEEILQKTREALDLKAQWRASQHQAPIDMPPAVGEFFRAMLLWFLLIGLLVFVARLIWR